MALFGLFNKKKKESLDKGLEKTKESVFGKIAERVYAKNLRFDIRSAIDSTSNVIPPVKAGEMNEAFQVLNSLKVPVQKQFTSKKGQEV